MDARRWSRKGAPISSIAALTVALLTTAGSVSAQELVYRGSLQYSTGSYVFAGRTHTVYLSSGLGLGAGPVRVDASVPLVLQNSTLVTRMAGEPLPTGGPDHEAVGNREPGMTIPGRRVRRSGSGVDSVGFRDAYRLELGDPTLYGSMELHSGTGRILAASLGGFLIFGDLSYWWLGDLPDLELRNGVGYGFGLGHSILEGRASLLGTLTGSESAVATLDPPLSVSISVGGTLQGNRQVNAGVSAGLTESSSDLGIYAGWSLPL